jgi:PAS domain S-box-containing protein
VTPEDGLATLASLAAVGFDPRAPGGRADDSPETSRRKAEARYRTLIEQIPAVTFLASLSGGRNEIYVSPQIESLLGFTQEEWVSDPVLWYRQTHPDDRDRVSREFGQLCLTGKPFREVVRMLARAGQTVWVHAEARLVRDEEGQLLFLQGVGFDVSDQYRAREAREALIREQAARAEAAGERDRLREVFSGLPAAITLLRGPEQTIEFLNPVALELAGGDADAPGKPFREVFAEFAEATQPVFDQVLATGQQVFMRELRVGCQHGPHHRFFNFICRPLWDDRGQLLLTHALDVTEQVHARREVEDALRLRDEFLSIASHELRTPIATLQVQAQLMTLRANRGNVDALRVQEAFGVINSQAGKLSRLVHQLLDISRLESGKLELEREPTDLVPLVDQLVANARSASAWHMIDVELPDSLEANVDALRVEQVITNLLDNAVKYSPNGGDIKVVLARVGDDAAELSVRDHGLGIPPDKRDEIFERFYQAHGNGSNRSGLGLGLYVSRQIVEMHGGSIRAEFPVDGGSRFVVRLPREL